jgi:hypothetical protein
LLGVVHISWDNTQQKYVVAEHRNVDHKSTSVPRERPQRSQRVDRADRPERQDRPRKTNRNQDENGKAPRRKYDNKKILSKPQSDESLSNYNYTFNKNTAQYEQVVNATKQSMKESWAESGESSADASAQAQTTESTESTQ